MADEFEQTRDSQRVTCKACKAVNLVEFTFGPGHGGWEDEDSYDCEYCGAELGSEKAFSIKVSLVEGPKLNREELKKGLKDTKAALKKAYGLLLSASGGRATFGLSKIVEATPALVQKLEADVTALEDELAIPKGK